MVTEITSNYRGPITFVDGLTIEPNQTVPVENWDDLKDRHFVKRLVEKGVLTVSEPSQAEEPSQAKKPTGQKAK